MYIKRNNSVSGKSHEGFNENLEQLSVWDSWVLLAFMFSAFTSASGFLIKERVWRVGAVLPFPIYFSACICDLGPQR